MNPKFLPASLLASILCAGLAMVPVMAQQGGTYTPGIDRAQQTIGARIQQGVASGQITQPEAQALYQREREIAARENRFKADGHVSYQERQQLHADLDGLNAEVDRMLSNRDRMRRADSTPGIDRRELRISQRIDEGVRSGRITEHEAEKLHRREREIERREAYFKSDGVATQREREQLRDELAALNDEVDRMMRSGRYEHHDGDYRRDGH
jgi:multidrug resistance efflux pump